MEFTIYSVGSAVYLEEVLNSVAMICGTGDIESLARIGFLIGALILGFQAVFNNTAIPFQKLLICLVLYMAMYGPSGRAVIEDVYDGDVAVVDNVPLGPLVVGSIISNIGYNLTNLFEQAFSTPAMTKYGFADPIETLMKVRSVTGNLMSIPSFTNGLGANKNLVNSWSNYFRECTLPMLGTDLQDYADLYRANDPMGAARFNSSVYYTQIFDGPAGGRTLNCSDAHTALVNLTDSATDNVMSEIATAGFKRPGKSVDPDAVASRIGDSLYALNMSATDARAYTMSSVLYPIFLQAPGQKAVEDLQGSYGVMMGQAMAQQNTQWAAEGTQFTKYVRPFMTFFEGLIYAITPLMAFLITMGGFGIGLIGKYLMLLAWMMLWMPALAIVNLYTVSSTASAMEAILQTSSFDVGGTGVSFEMLKQMGPALEQAIGVAGLMASSIPAICLFLVSGTAIAASGIAGRMNGSDKIDEKIASPDVLTPSAGLQTTPYATSDFDKGVRINGSENQRGNISVGSMLSETIQSSKATSEGSSQAFSKQFTSTMGKSLDNSKTIGEAADIGHSLQTSLGLDKNAGFQAKYDGLRSQGYSANNIDAAIASVALSGGVDGKLGASAAAGVDGGPTGVKGGVNGSLGLSGGVTGSSTDQTSRSDGKAYADTVSAVKSSGLGETVKSALQKTDGTTLAKNFQSADRSSISKADQESLSKSAQKTINDQMAYQKVSGLANTYGYSEDMKLDSLTGKVINEGRDRAVVGDAMNKYGQEFQQNQQMFSQTMLDPKRANTAAALYTLAKHHDFEALTGATVDYDKNANLRSPSVGNVEAEANNAGHMVDTGAFNSRFNREKTAAIADAHQNIAEKHERNDRIVENDGEVYAKKALDPSADRAAGRIRDSATEVNDRGESSSGILAAASNGIGSTLGTRATREEYVHEGQRLGLNQAQADVFATARVGGLTDNSKERWDSYAASNHMDKDLANGMYKQLVEAGLHDNGSGGHLADILTLNQRDNLGADITSSSAIPRQEPVYTAPPHLVNNGQGNPTNGYGGNATEVASHNQVQRPDLDRVHNSTPNITRSSSDSRTDVPYSQGLGHAPDQGRVTAPREEGVSDLPRQPANEAGIHQADAAYAPNPGHAPDQGRVTAPREEGVSDLPRQPVSEAGIHQADQAYAPKRALAPDQGQVTAPREEGVSDLPRQPANEAGIHQADAAYAPNPGLTPDQGQVTAPREEGVSDQPRQPAKDAGIHQADQAYAPNRALAPDQGHQTAPKEEGVSDLPRQPVNEAGIHQADAAHSPNPGLAPQGHVIASKEDTVSDLHKYAANETGVNRAQDAPSHNPGLTQIPAHAKNPRDDGGKNLLKQSANVAGNQQAQVAFSQLPGHMQDQGYVTNHQDEGVSNLARHPVNEAGIYQAEMAPSPNPADLLGQGESSGFRDHGVSHAAEYPARDAGAYQAEGPTYYPVQGQDFGHGHASTLNSDGLSNAAELPANEAGGQQVEAPTHFPLPRQEPRPMSFSNSVGDGVTNMAEYPGNGFGTNQTDVLSLNHRDSSGLEGSTNPSQAKAQGPDKTNAKYP